MSGGAYNYAYAAVHVFAEKMAIDSQLADYTDPELRRRFRDHLTAVAEAMKAIEWNDTGDGARNERELIRKCLDHEARS